jgi:mono/diheme cytochrome c family protein
VLGVNTRQMNCEFPFPSGTADNQLRAWNHIGLFAPKIDETALAHLPKLAHVGDKTRSPEDRARSYLDANCAHCHRPGGTVAYFDARYQTALTQQDLVDGPVRFNQGLDKARVVAPNDPWRSIALLRVESLGGDKMPPLAHNVLDQEGAALLRQWIASLPGPTVLAPPIMRPAGGKFAEPVEVTLSHADPGASIRYTLDGSVPTASDPLYESPIKLTEPATVRAKAFKTGCTRSITAQQTFIVGN